ncbi:hypothetical protein ACHWQZ_G009016 [Mnemiopsis leidyi]
MAIDKRTINDETWEHIKNAVKAGKLEEVCEIYKTNNVEYTDVGGQFKQSLLHIASGRGELDIVRYCVQEEKVDVNIQDSGGFTALHLAAGWGHLQILKYLLEKGADVNIQDSRGMTALHRAVGTGNLQVFKYLLEKGADVNIQNSEGEAALHRAADRGDLQVVEYLLEKGADVNIQNSEGEAALHRAADRGDLQVVEYLLEKGADVNIQDSKGKTALCRAAGWGHLQVLKYLLEKGADVNMQDSEGEAALHRAADRGHLQVLKYLLEQGADVNIQDSEGMTALHLAAGTGDLQIVEYLLEKGADVNIQDSKGKTALCWAAPWGHLQVLKYLLEKGADVNIQDSEGKTALHLAARDGNLQVFKYLLEKGADVNIQDSEGMTVLHLAAVERHFQVVICLAIHGGDISQSWVTINAGDVGVFLNKHWQKLTLKEFDVLSDISNRAIGSNEIIEEVNKNMNKKLAEIIDNSPDFANDPNNLFLFYRGNLYKNLIQLFVRNESQCDNNKMIAFDVVLLKAIYVAIQSKNDCNTSRTIVNHSEVRKEKGENRRFHDILGGELYRKFEERITKILKDQEKLNNVHLRDRFLIAYKIHNKYIKSKKGCVKTMKTHLASCWKGTKTVCIDCVKCCCKKECICKLPRLLHKCKARGNFTLISCTIAILVYLLDLITDFTVGYEDYNGFSKKLGIFEMFLVVFTLLYENIWSSFSLYETEEELLKIKLGKQNIKITDWNDTELLKRDNPAAQIITKMFWPFAIRKKDGCLQCFKAVIYNLLTIFQLRPVVDRLRVLMHSPTNMRVIHRHRTEQDSLKQFYLITEQIPELLIQFYTLQIVFNITGSVQSESYNITSGCESGHNFSYPRFTDSLNDPDDRNWFCSNLPIDSNGGLLTCDILFRIFSAMIPFFMIPSGIVSLEVDFRRLDPTTPKIKKAVEYLLQAAYTLMIPARLLMFAALMHAVPKKEIIFGYIIMRIVVELSINLVTLTLRDFRQINKEGKSVEKGTHSWISKYAGHLCMIWRLSMFGIRDLFAISIRETQAYMISPSEVTYKSIREGKSLTKRCLIFLLEGLVGAWIIEEFYPCGRHTEIFRYIGWMCLASLLLSVTLITLISDLLHPKHLYDKRNALKTMLISAGLCILFGVVCSFVFILTNQRTFTEKWFFFEVLLHMIISGVVIIIIKHEALPSKKSTKDSVNKESKESSNSRLCCFGVCCPSKSSHRYKKVPKQSSPGKTVLEQTSTKETVQEQTFTEKTLPEQTFFKETVPVQTSSKETLPEQIPLKEMLPEQRSSYEMLPEQISSKETLPEQRSSKETLPEQTSSK